MPRGMKVDGEDREVAFMDGTSRTFRKVTCVDSYSCMWYRLYCEDGIAILNPKNVKYILVLPKK